MKFVPRGEFRPKGWTLSPRGNVHPFVHPQGWTHCLEEWKDEHIISPQGDKVDSWGTTSPLGSKFAPRGEVKNGRQDVCTIFRNRSSFNLNIIFSRWWLHSVFVGVTINQISAQKLLTHCRRNKSSHSRGFEFSCDHTESWSCCCRRRRWFWRCEPELSFDLVIAVSCWTIEIVYICTIEW
jgi:hypothetical protein